VEFIALLWKIALVIWITFGAANVMVVVYQQFKWETKHEYLSPSSNQITYLVRRNFGKEFKGKHAYQVVTLIVKFTLTCIFCALFFFLFGPLGSVSLLMEDTPKRQL
jgi:hypothetical protein